MSRWITGGAIPELPTLRRIASFLGCTVAELTGDAPPAHVSSKPLQNDSDELKAARERVEILKLELEAAKLRAEIAALQPAPTAAPSSVVRGNSSETPNSSPARAPFAVIDGPGAPKPLADARPQPEAFATEVERAAAATLDTDVFISLFPALQRAVAMQLRPHDTAASVGISNPSRILLAHLSKACHYKANA